LAPRVSFLATSGGGVTTALCPATKGVADLKIGDASFHCRWCDNSAAHQQKRLELA
jgi:hypothetical protein